MELSETRKANGTDFYKLADTCKHCGSDNMAIRYISSNNSMQQMCIDCGFYVTIPKISNWNARANSSVNHWANRIKIRDNYTCRICGKQSYQNEAHHIICVDNLDANIRALMYLDNNGITLCKRCHWLAHHKADGSYSFKDFIYKESEEEND